MIGMKVEEVISRLRGHSLRHEAHPPVGSAGKGAEVHARDLTLKTAACKPPFFFSGTVYAD